MHIWLEGCRRMHSLAGGSSVWETVLCYLAYTGETLPLTTSGLHAESADTAAKYSESADTAVILPEGADTAAKSPEIGF